MADRNSRWVIPGLAPQPRGPHPLEVLVISPVVPYPPVWGFAQRVFQLSRHLAGAHRVTFLSYAQDDQRPDVVDMARFVHEVVAVVHPPKSRLARRLLQVQSMFSRLPFHAAGLRSSAFQQAVADTVAARRFDVVILESSQLGWLSVPAGTPVIIDEHNIESELLERMAQSERSPLRRTYYRYELSRYRRFEERAWAGAAGCAVTSERDASRLVSRNPHVRTAVVPNGVDVEHFAPGDAQEVPDRIIFTGMLDYRPNFDGITWFLDDVYPIVRQRRPAVELQVVGIGSPHVLDSLRRPGVEVTGRVPDLRDYLDPAAVAIVPLRIGGGTRLKVVEAMSMGKAIVSTSLGAEGIDTSHDRDILVADDPADFASAVCDLLDDRERRSRLGAAARELAVRQYAWARAADGLGDLLQRVVPRPRRSREGQLARTTGDSHPSTQTLPEVAHE